MERAIRWYFGKGPKPWLSSFSIAATNLFMLYGVLSLRWDVFVIMFLCWVDNVVFGVFTALRLLIIAKDKIARVYNLFFLFLHCVSYGVICIIFGAAVFELFGGIDKSHRLTLLFDAVLDFQFGRVLVGVLDYAPWIATSLALIGAMHSVEFIRFCLRRGYRTADGIEIWKSGFIRMMVLSLVVFFMGFCVALTGSSRCAVCLIIVAKTLFELRIDWLQRTAPPEPDESALIEGRPKRKQKPRQQPRVAGEPRHGKRGNDTKIKHSQKRFAEKKE